MITEVFFAETYNQRDYTKLGVDIAFVQDNHSVNGGAKSGHAAG